jgi:CubicO group peptidase (beta-lactamase class C family)
LATSLEVDVVTAQSELQEFLTEAAERLRVPGAAAGLIVGGREIAAYHGVTSIENPLPVDERTLFSIGSTTKTFVATAVMHLVEQGRVDLEATVRTYLPDLRLQDEDTAARVRVIDLLTHTGGWLGDWFADGGDGDDAVEKVVAKMVEIPQLTPVGTVWAYNNSGFFLAGRIVEVITGKPFDAALADLVFRPLGLAHSALRPADIMVHRFAAGHTVLDSGTKVARYANLGRGTYPAGGIFSTIPDQLRYARFHLGDRSVPGADEVLSLESIELMQQPRFKAGGMADHVGIAWLLGDLPDGSRSVAHGGNLSNLYLSSFQLVPRHGFAVTVLTNANPGAALHAELGRWALDRFLDLKPADPVTVELGPSELAEFEGVYHGPLMKVTLTAESGGLRFHAEIPAEMAERFPAPPPVHFAFTGADSIVGTDGPYQGARGDFLRGEDGAVRWLRFGGRLSRRATTEVG